MWGIHVSIAWFAQMHSLDDPLCPIGGLPLSFAFIMILKPNKNFLHQRVPFMILCSEDSNNYPTQVFVCFIKPTMEYPTDNDTRSIFEPAKQRAECFVSFQDLEMICL
ncbi:hypothetical protein AWENTII_004352 [Aspergillus wentii]